MVQRVDIETPHVSFRAITIELAWLDSTKITLFQDEIPL